jgi:transcriptional regulator of arginine metabolism
MPIDKKEQKNPQFKLIEDLKKLLVDGKVTTQEDICSALEALGHPINQSKASRLLRKVGAVKSKNEQGQVVYRLPREPAPPTISSHISDLVIDVVANETQIIVNTSPGAAQLVARIIDYHKHAIKVLGTIAGDDTILITPLSIKKINNSIDAIKKLLFCA